MGAADSGTEEDVRCQLLEKEEEEEEEERKVAKKKANWQRNRLFSSSCIHRSERKLAFSLACFNIALLLRENIEFLTSKVLLFLCLLPHPPYCPDVLNFILSAMERKSSSKVTQQQHHQHKQSVKL